MLHRTTAIESLPVGASNPQGIVEANFDQIEKCLDPDNTNHSLTGLNYDVANAIRNRVFGGPSFTGNSLDQLHAEVLSGSTPTIDFDTEAVKIYTNITQALTFSFVNAGHGKFVLLLLSTQDDSEAITWPTSTDLVWLLGGGTDHDTVVQGTRAVISSITSDGVTWTVTTATRHGFTAADTVVIKDTSIPAHDGTHTVAAITSTTVFTITNAANLSVSSGGHVMESQFAISAIANNGTLWTVTTVGNHPFSVSDTIKIIGSDVDDYNGGHTINTTPTATTFTISRTEQPTAGTDFGIVIERGETSAAAAAAPTTVGNVAVAVTAITSDGTKLTVTTSAPHGFVTGNTVEIIDSDVPAYNIAGELDSASGSTFTILSALNTSAATTANVFLTPSPFTFIKLECLGGVSSSTLVFGTVQKEDSGVVPEPQ